MSDQLPDHSAVDADIDAALGKPYTAEDWVEAAGYWLKSPLGAALPEAKPMFKALVDVLRECQRRGDERDRLRRRLEHAEQWYGVRWARLRDEAEKHDDEIAIAFSNIMANGTSAAVEPPTYAQQMNVLRHDRDRLRAENERLRLALEAAIDCMPHHADELRVRAIAAVASDEQEGTK